MIAYVNQYNGQSACYPICQLLYQLKTFKYRGFRNLGEFIGSIYTRVRAFYDAIASYLEGNLSGVKAPVSPRERPVRKRRLARWKGMPGPARCLEQRQKKAFASLSSTLKSKRSVNSSRALSVHRYGSPTLGSSALHKSRNRLNDYFHLDSCIHSFAIFYRDIKRFRINEFSIDVVVPKHVSLGLFETLWEVYNKNFLFSRIESIFFVLGIA